MTSLFFCQNDSLMGDQFGKRTAWSLLYFLNYAYLNILAQSQILVNSLYFSKFCEFIINQTYG